MSARAALASLLWLPALTIAADTPAVAASQTPTTAGSLLQVFIGLVAVLLLIAAMAWMAKRLGVARGGSSALLNVIASASVGTRERVVLLEIGESWMVVGVAPGSVNALATLPKGEIPPTASMPLPPFAARLQHLLEKNRGK